MRLCKNGACIILLFVLMLAGAQAQLVEQKNDILYQDGIVLSGPVKAQGAVTLNLPTPLSKSVIKVAVVDSQGTDDMPRTIWNELNSNWSTYGADQVIIDYTSLNKENITYAEIAATAADVLVISCASPYVYEYTTAEVQAITQYVTEGHGIVITYYSLARNNANLAPLVGLSSSLYLETNTFSRIDYDLLDPQHPLFVNVPDPYNSGLVYMNTPGIYPAAWPVTTGVIVASAMANTGGFIKEGVIIYNEVATHRGVYHSHYIEDQSSGSNSDDKQTFYNSLVWVSESDGSLSADTTSIIASMGGTVNFTLDAGTSFAGRNYILAGSLTGTSPGTQLPGGLVTMPLNRDKFTNFILARLNSPIFTDFWGTLDAQGTATAQLNAPPVSGWGGRVMSFAYCTAFPYDYVSNAVDIAIVP